MDTVFEKISSIIREVTGDTSSKIEPQTVAQDIPGWDSISHVDIIVNIEQLYDVKFPIGDLKRLQNVGQLVDKTKEHIASKS